MMPRTRRSFRVWRRVIATGDTELLELFCIGVMGSLGALLLFSPRFSVQSMSLHALYGHISSTAWGLVLLAVALGNLVTLIANGARSIPHGFALLLSFIAWGVVTLSAFFSVVTPVAIVMFLWCLGGIGFLYVRLLARTLNE